MITSLLCRFPQLLSKISEIRTVYRVKLKLKKGFVWEEAYEADFMSEFDRMNCFCLVNSEIVLLKPSVN